MIKYRPHRGGLAEAMAEAKEFDTIEEMKEHVWHTWNDWVVNRQCELFDIDDIVIGDIIGDDDRIGWKNVRHICVRRFGDQMFFEHPQCIGWCGE